MMPGSGWITSAVQLGFIAGTLVYALLTLSDRYPASAVFLVSVLLAAGANAAILIGPLQTETLLLSRFGTGFFLAGVYPVGMKIAADWFRPVLGRAMGFLVGALVLGTAFPHLLRGLGATLPYRTVLLGVSLLAVTGGVLLFAAIPSRPPAGLSVQLDRNVLRTLFWPSRLRSAALGYFGHMWELYTVWAFLPTLLALYLALHPAAGLNVSLWSFAGIAAGFVGCAGGGLLALRWGSHRVAAGQLLLSGLCILTLPLFIDQPPVVFLTFLLVWGAAAAGDSPQFSTLVSAHAPSEVRGSILTLVTCLGFSITIASIQLMAWLLEGPARSAYSFWALLPGPVLGLWAMRRYFPAKKANLTQTEQAHNQ